eukprot:364630-Chlamydomonas_euryale.AAC.10
MHVTRSCNVSAMISRASDSHCSVEGSGEPAVKFWHHLVPSLWMYMCATQAISHAASDVRPLSLSHSLSLCRRRATFPHRSRSVSHRLPISLSPCAAPPAAQNHNPPHSFSLPLISNRLSTSLFLDMTAYTRVVRPFQTLLITYGVTWMEALRCCLSGRNLIWHQGTT